VINRYSKISEKHLLIVKNTYFLCIFGKNTYFQKNICCNNPFFPIMAITTHKSHSQLMDYVKTSSTQHAQNLEDYWNNNK
jgi:hypothetical protein